MSPHHLAVQCEALFASDLQSSQRPEPRHIRRAILDMIMKFGARYCVAQVAQEFGDHPETAVTRMRWAREAVAEAYCDRNVFNWPLARVTSHCVRRSAG
jgi:hypothetical protein